MDSSEQLGTFKDFIKTFPEIDTPEIFGLHPNADLTFRVKEVNALFGTLGNTQPKVNFTLRAVLPFTACDIPVWMQLELEADLTIEACMMYCPNT